MMQHNKYSARFTSIPQAVEMVETFLNTEFEGEDIKVDKISLLINIQYKVYRGKPVYYN
jgi:ribose 5-phosphate isomerase RpiB